MKKIHRFLTEFKQDGNTVTIENKTLIHQIGRVLRFEAGENIILCRGDGIDHLIALTNVTKHEVTGRIVSSTKNNTEPTRSVTLYVAILKKENFETVIEKAVETGVRKIVPIITERTVKTGLKRERLLDIIREAAEQSGRGIVPELQETRSFREAIDSLLSPNEAYLCDPSGENISSLQILPVACSYFIGPEGGFTEKEIASAQARGVHTVSLGKLILRGETAAIIAGYLFANK